MGRGKGEGRKQKSAKKGAEQEKESTEGEKDRRSNEEGGGRTERKERKGGRVSIEYSPAALNSRGGNPGPSPEGGLMSP